MATVDDELPQFTDLRSLRVHEQLGESGSVMFWSANYKGQNIMLKIVNHNTKPAAAKQFAVKAAGNGFSQPTADETNLLERMFLREAKITMQIFHRHIVRCFGVAQLPGGFVPGLPAPALAAALERCEPQSVKDLITKGMAAGRRLVKAAEALWWLTQLASALSHLHSQKPPIIHRDIRADNILLQRAPSGKLACKLSGFGLYAILYDDRSNSLRRRGYTNTTFNPLAEGSTAGVSDEGLDDGAGDVGGSTRTSTPAALGPRATAEAVRVDGTGARSGAGAGQWSSGTGRPSCNNTAEQNGHSGRNGGGGGGDGGGGDEPTTAEAAANPVAGLGDVESLLRQLGVSKLPTLQPQDMERVYEMPEKAESFLYMAPEVFNNLPCSERSDVFSFGVLAYELLTGELLSISIFNTGRAARMGLREPQGYAAKVAEGHRPARSQAVSDAAWALLERCWHPDPAQRPTMAEVEAELRRLAGGANGSGGSPGATAQFKGGKAPAAAAAGLPKAPWEAAAAVAADSAGDKAAALVPSRAPFDGPSPGCAQGCVLC